MINPNTPNDWRKDVKVMFNSDEATRTHFRPRIRDHR